MNMARVGLLVVAVTAAGVAAVLVRSLTHHKPSAPSAPEVQQQASVGVLVAARALEPGDVLTSGDLKWQDWPESSLAPSFLTNRASPSALDDEVGAMVRAHLEPGEPITSTKVLKAGSASFMAVMLTPGMRAVSTKISEETGAGGFILPGDHVDVIATRRIDRSEDSGSGGGFESETILHDIRVLAIGQSVQGSNSDDKALNARTATLELWPAQAERLALANASGTITLDLRSAVTGDVTGAIAQQGDFAKSIKRTIQVVRYGQPSNVSTKAGNFSGGGQ